ncbi:hypothetical protein TNCV_1343171 [Trichonephila clavipes]|nr:hypothetical protein TNCV_1343171 [Trichonephila clavipes]
MLRCWENIKSLVLYELLKENGMIFSVRNLMFRIQKFNISAHLWPTEKGVILHHDNAGLHRAKKVASIQQITRKAVPLTSAKRIIKKMDDLSSTQYAERSSNRILWSNLKDLPMLLRRKAVAKFRQANRLDCFLNIYIEFLWHRILSACFSIFGRTWILTTFAASLP